MYSPSAGMVNMIGPCGVLWSMKGLMLMRTRPSMICMKKGSIKRRTMRSALTFAIVAIILLCCGVDFLLSLLFSGITVVVVRLFVFK